MRGERRDLARGVEVDAEDVPVGAGLHSRQSSSDAGRGFKVKVLKLSPIVLPSTDSGERV